MSRSHQLKRSNIMSNLIAYIFRFLFRIKWWLLICPAVVALCVYYYMGKQPRVYKATMTIYTGIATGYDPENDQKQDWSAINTAMDNLINIILSKSTLQEVSLKLYARCMSHGDVHKDNNYIWSKNYNLEVAHTPASVLKMIVPGDEQATYDNLKKIEKDSHDNHIYGLFNWEHRYYSYNALSKISVKRVNNSDMLEVSYENDDPGVVYNTLEILSREYVNQYKDIRYGETNNVINFFEQALAEDGSHLQQEEDSLRDYSVEKQVINYDEQTKNIAGLSMDYELKVRDLQMQLNSAEKLQQSLETQLDALQGYRSNSTFLDRMKKIGDLESRISISETYNGVDGNASKNNARLKSLRRQLLNQTDSLKRQTLSLSTQRYTKEGFPIESLVQQWLDALLTVSKCKSEIAVFSDWKKSLDSNYKFYAPVGSTLKRKTRYIGFTEQTYLSTLQSLNDARLRQKNLEMTSASLKLINPPTLPISAEPSKRKMTVVASFFATMCFILGICILIELVDRTLRDDTRTERITGSKVIGVFPAPGRFLLRKYDDKYKALASKSLGNSIMSHFVSDKIPHIINILSTEQGDGKSVVIEGVRQYFEKLGMNVKVESWNKDFNSLDRSFLLASNPREFIKEKDNELQFDKADIVLMEYPPLSETSIPASLLMMGDLNIVIALADNTWRTTDQMLFDKVSNVVGKDHLVICLNRVSRDVLESYTGLLPPYTPLRKLGYQLGQFGLTSSR